MSVTVNKKYYLLTILLLSGMMAHLQVDAKSAGSYTVSKGDNLTVQQAQNNRETSSDTQDQPAPRPKIGQILFSGNAQISSDELQKVIPLKKQQIANENTIMDSMVKIAQLYKTKNIKVTITPVLENTQVHTINIRFDIHELQMNKQN